MDDVTWAGLTLTLTLIGALWTWFAFRRRGLAAGLRGMGLTLLPIAAYLTQTLRMFTRILDAVVDWAASLALSPVVWAGLVVLGLAVALLVTASALSARGIGVRRGGARPQRAAGAGGQARQVAAGRTPTEPDDADGMAEIEALLRKRGIS